MDDVVDDGTDGSGDESTDGAEPTPLVPFIVEPSPTYGPAQGAWPAAAFGGTQYLAVWQDHRVWRPILYGARVAADGTTLDPYGFRILDVVPEALDQHERVLEYEPDVAFDGENFLIVTRASGRIHGVRVSLAGEVLDPGGFVLAISDSASRPSLVFDGEQYLVAWSQSDPGLEGVFQARVEPNGTVLDPDGVFVHESHHPENADQKSSVGISFDGTTALLSWVTLEQTSSLYAIRTAVDGTAIDQAPFRLSPEDEDVNHHAAGFDGSNHVIAWEAGWPAHIRASRVTPEGTILDPEGFVVEDGIGPMGEYLDSVYRLDMASGDGRSIVVWNRYPDSNSTYPDPVGAARIATDGTTSLLPQNAFPSAFEATVATNADGALLVWVAGTHSRMNPTAIVGRRLDVGGIPVGDPVPPASPASRQDVMGVASNGQIFFVLWRDTRDPTGRALHGARVGADGTPLDDESLQLTAGPVISANVVFDGANFVVTWFSPDDGEGDSLCPESGIVRVSPAGERLDVEPLEPAFVRYAAVASDGTNTLLGGWTCTEVAEDSVYVTLLLDQEGEMAGAPVTIPHPGDHGAAAFDGSSYLVVWHDEFSEQLFGQRITQAGALAGQAFVIATSEAHRVSIAAGGGQHLVVWDTDSGIWAARVRSDGQVLDPDGLLIAALQSSLCWEPNLGTCSAPSVTFDGENFVVAWREDPGDGSSLDLYAVEVSPEGEVTPRFPISREPEREGAPFLVMHGEAQVLAAYSRFIAGPPYDTRRAVATFLP